MHLHAGRVADVARTGRLRLTVNHPRDLPLADQQPLRMLVPVGWVGFLAGGQYGIVNLEAFTGDQRALIDALDRRLLPRL